MDQLRDDLKRLLGLPPYDTMTNISRGDGYFAKYLEEKYGSTIEELRKRAGV